MDPFLHKLNAKVTAPVDHAHLLVAESGGLVTMESPGAVMDEVAFRATHVSALLEEMFEDCRKHDCFWPADEA